MNRREATSICGESSTGERRRGGRDDCSLPPSSCWSFGKRDESLPGLLGVSDRGVELDSLLLVVSNHVESFGVDPGHDRRRAAGNPAKRIGMIVVHVIDDARFLRKRKRIL